MMLPTAAARAIKRRIRASNSSASTGFTRYSSAPTWSPAIRLDREVQAWTIETRGGKTLLRLARGSWVELVTDGPMTLALDA